jgi:hypothetical protein
MLPGTYGTLVGLKGSVLSPDSPHLMSVNVGTTYGTDTMQLQYFFLLRSLDGFEDFVREVSELLSVLCHRPVGCSSKIRNMYRGVTVTRHTQIK